MSENIKKIEVALSEDGTEQYGNDRAKPRKHKHNSRRRKSNKNNTECDLEVSELENVTKILCKDILSSEPEPQVRVLKESSKILKNAVNSAPHAPMTPSDLSVLLKNLAIGKTKPNKTANVHFVEMINHASSPCNSNSSKEKKKKKSTSKKKPKDNATNDLRKECFNCSAHQNETLMNSVQLRKLCLPGVMPEPREMNHVDNVPNPCGIDEDLYPEFFPIIDSSQILQKSPPELFINRKNNSSLGKNKKSKKKKIEKKNSKEYLEESVKMFKGSQKVLVNSELFQRSDTIRSSSQAPLNSGKCKKKHSSMKNSDSSPKQSNEFPRYLTSDEVKLMSSYGVLMSGIIRINQKNYKEAYVSAPDKGMDILIDGLRDRNRALEGDEVYFVLKPKEHHRTNTDSTDIQRTAVVVGLKAMNHNQGAVGTLNPIKNKNDSFALFSPRDARLPRIKIRKNNWPVGFSENPLSFKDKLWFVKISQWNDLRFADGELVKEVGLIGDIEAETSALLLSHDLDVSPYKESVKQCITPAMYSITESEIQGREDYRKECIITIDPATAVDLDDAVSCKRLPNGNYEIGVHIADVSHYLKAGTPLDEAVAKRATTVYLVQRAYHMLPNELCRLCSLTPGEDKLSFSVLWEITPDFKILNHRFAKTVMNSCGQFAYEQVQSILDGVPLEESNFPKLHGNHTLSKIKEIVLFLHKMAVQLRSERFENGALRIDQRKIKFSLDDAKLPVEFTVETHEESHRMIEEFMLLANITVAKELSQTFPEIAFLRSHSPPISYMLKKLQKNLEKYDIKLNIATAGSINDSLMSYSGVEKEAVARTLVLNNLLAKPMTRANYYCSGLYPSDEDRRHYALNVALYTHFTSPIRRYADVMVHRLLTSIVTNSDPPKWTVQFVDSIANNCNRQKYAAKMAGEASMELYLAVYIGLNGAMQFDAVVCDVKDRSFDCIILATGAHQRVYFERIQAELKQTTENGISCLIVKWPANEVCPRETVQTIKMFSIVRVELKRGNALKVEASLLRSD